MRVEGRAPPEKKKKKKFLAGCCYMCGLFERAAPQPERGCASAQSSVTSGHFTDGTRERRQDMMPSPQEKKLAGALLPSAWSHACQRWEGAGPAEPAGPEGLAANMLSCWMFLAAKTAGAGGDGADCRCALSRRGRREAGGRSECGRVRGVAQVCVQSRRCRSG